MIARQSRLMRESNVTKDEALRFVEQHGVVLEAARGSVPTLADAALGAERRGSWWGHPQGKAFFWLTRQVRASKNVLVCRLVDGKITYVHRRVWPALVRLAPAIEAARLAAIHEVHTASGAHRVHRTAFSKWVGPDVRAEAALLSETDALAQIGPLAPLASRPRSRRSAT
jgi:hypothetical protein